MFFGGGGAFSSGAYIYAVWSLHGNFKFQQGKTERVSEQEKQKKQERKEHERNFLKSTVRTFVEKLR